VKPWALAGLLLVAVAVPILIRSANRFPTREASMALYELAADLDEYAGEHGWRYPESLDELAETGFSTFARDPRDPWGRAYLYERHPEDPTRCRAWTLGADARPDGYVGTDDVVLYKIRGRTIWKQALGDVPREWTSLGGQGTLGLEPGQQ
jgi:hypothetical protein